MEEAELRAREDRALRGAVIGFAVTAVLAAGIVWAAIETQAAILGLLAFIVFGVGLGILVNARMRVAFARFHRLRAARRGEGGGAGA